MSGTWKVFVTSFLFIAATATGSAQAFSYKYLEATYLETDISVADGDGGAIGGSWLFSDHWIVFGRYSESSVEGSLNGVQETADFEYIRFGVGYRASLPGLAKTDWYGLISYNEIDLTKFEDETESGEDFELGIKHALAPTLEVELAARYFYSNIECIDLLAGEAGWRTGAVWWMTEGIGFSFGYEDIDNFNELTIGLRGSW